MQQGSREGNREPLAGLDSCVSRDFHVLFSKARSTKGASSQQHTVVVQLCLYTWEFTPSTPVTGVMLSFQCKISAGHETEMGKLRGDTMYRELPSHVLWERRILEPFCNV